jgi:hypothetical protein
VIWASKPHIAENEGSAFEIASDRFDIPGILFIVMGGQWNVTDILASESEI